MYHPTPLRICLLGGLLLPFLLSCGRAEKAEPQKLIRPVRYMQVFSTGGRQLRTFSGTARAGVESKLSFKVNGTIRQIQVALGDTVMPGQVLAEIDPTDYQLKVGKGRDRYRKTTGGCVESNPSRFVKIFNTKKEAEKFVVEHHKTRWKGMIKRILERDELTLDQYTKIGEILGMKEFSPF